MSALPSKADIGSSVRTSAWCHKQTYAARQKSIVGAPSALWKCQIDLCSDLVRLTVASHRVYGWHVH